MPFCQFYSTSSKVIIVLISRIITAIIGVLFVPIYVKLIGIESYGLVAFFGTLSGSLTILDLGLGMAISRQLSVLRVQGNKQKEMKDLLYSVEVIYWAIAILTGILIISLSNSISIYWINSKNLPIQTIRGSVILMGGVFAFQFPSSIYNGAMIAFEKQVLNAVISTIFTIIKAVGVILILKILSPTIQCYFIWQLIATIFFTASLRFLARKDLFVKKGKAFFSTVQLKSISSFAAGMTSISLVTFFLAQIDKIVVSKMVVLSYVGYYNLAFVVASVITQVISPLQPVLFPKFSKLIVENKQAELITLYHKSCRWIAIIVFPLGFTLLLFANEILEFWTRNHELATNTAPMLRVFVIGTICNSLFWVPYFYLLAKGITKYTFYQNIISCIIMVPLLFWLTNKYGAIGASFVWLIINVGCFIISIPIFHAKILNGELLQWYKNDNAYPFFISILIILAAKAIEIFLIPKMTLFYFLLIVLGMIVAYSILIKELRDYIFEFKQKSKWITH